MKDGVRMRPLGTTRHARAYRLRSLFGAQGRVCREGLAKGRGAWQGRRVDDSDPAASAFAPGTAGGRGEYCNVVLWLVFAGVSVLVGFWFILGVHRLFSLDIVFGLAALVTRTGLYVALGVMLEALLLRPWGRGRLATRLRRVAVHGLWIAVMVVTVGVFVDVFVFAFAGYHLTTAIAILFADGAAGVGGVMEATGISRERVVLGGGGLVLGLVAAVFLSRATERYSGLLRRSFSWWRTGRAALAMVGLLAVLDTAGFQVRNPFLWDLENRRVPLAFSVVRPEAALASFRVSLVPPAPLPEPPAPVAEREDLPDIYVIVVESLRKEMLDPAVMPNFARFAREGWTFDHAVTAGNVTHYSWFGLLCARQPIYYDVVKDDPARHGSVPLAWLRALGYETHLLASPDTAYQQLQSIIFGADGRLLTAGYHPPAKTPVERDRMVVDRLLGDLAKAPPGGRFYLVALDSTHFEYTWGEDFEPPFKPYAAGASMVKNYHRNRVAREEVFNRYKNAAAWMDGQLGRLLDGLRASGRMERSMIVITGDHGESFWERGPGTHGSLLCPEQTEVAFAMRLPNREVTRFPVVFSLLDVMPTLLSELDAMPGPEAGLAGVPFQTRLAAPGGPSPGYAITFQGWNARTFDFALTFGSRQILLQLDRADPADCKRLAIVDVIPGPELPPLSQQGDAAVYRSMMGRLAELPEYLPFLRFE